MVGLTDIALILGALSGALYGLIFLQSQPSLSRSSVKTLPLATLALLAWSAGAPWLLAAALGLSALGDLSLSRTGERAFLLGLGAFLAAHLAYIAVFFAVFELPSLYAQALAMIIVVPIGLAAARLIVLYAPQDLRLAVGLYCFVISLMLLCALAVANQSLLLALGSILFVFSDFCLGFALFRRADLSPGQEKLFAHLVWWSYLGAQALLFWALV